MTSIERLDLVLTIIVEKIPRYMTVDEIVSQVTQRMSNDEHFSFLMFDLQMVVEKLIEDKNVTTIELKPTNLNTGESKLVTHYKPTFKGMYLIETGGYQELDRLSRAEKIRLDKVELATKVNRRTTTRLTVIIAVGTAIAAWYYGIEVWKFYSHCACK
ncbi:MAG: hypothetical protein V4539_09015 [Bacteroidota bacterium]